MLMYELAPLSVPFRCGAKDNYCIGNVKPSFILVYAKYPILATPVMRPFGHRQCDAATFSPAPLAKHRDFLISIPYCSGWGLNGSRLFAGGRF